MYVLFNAKHIFYHSFNTKATFLEYQQRSELLFILNLDGEYNLMSAIKM